MGGVQKASLTTCPDELWDTFNLDLSLKASFWMEQNLRTFPNNIHLHGPPPSLKSSSSGLDIHFSLISMEKHCYNWAHADVPIYALAEMHFQIRFWKMKCEKQSMSFSVKSSWKTKDQLKPLMRIKVLYQPLPSKSKLLNRKKRTHMENTFFLPKN